MKKARVKSFLKATIKNLMSDKIIDEYRFNEYRRRTEIERPVLIVVLDACRYDSFKEAYNGELPKKL